VTSVRRFKIQNALFISLTAVNKEIKGENKENGDFNTERKKKGA